MGWRQDIYIHTYGGTLQLYERIGQEADSLKILVYIKKMYGQLHFMFD